MAFVGVVPLGSLIKFNLIIALILIVLVKD